jgi:hypothetical protein
MGQTNLTRFSRELRLIIAHVEMAPAPGGLNLAVACRWRGRISASELVISRTTSCWVELSWANNHFPMVSPGRTPLTLCS